MSFDSPKDINLRLEEFYNYLKQTTFRNLEITSKYKRVFSVESGGRTQKKRDTLLDIDAGYVNSEEEYNQKMKLISDVCIFPFEKAVSDNCVVLRAKSGTVRMVIYIWISYELKKREEEFLEMLSNVSGCKMVMKVQHHKAYTTTAIVCENK